MDTKPNMWCLEDSPQRSAAGLPGPGDNGSGHGGLYLYVQAMNPILEQPAQILNTPLAWGKRYSARI